MFWVIGAASFSGFVITAFFAIMATGQFVKRAAFRAATKTGNRAAFGRYWTGLISLCLFCLMIARACYLATVLVDTELRTPTVPLIAVSSQSAVTFARPYGSQHIATSSNTGQHDN